MAIAVARLVVKAVARCHSLDELNEVQINSGRGAAQQWSVSPHLE